MAARLVHRWAPTSRTAPGREEREVEKVTNPLFEKSRRSLESVVRCRPRRTCIKWSKVVLIQRLKVPTALNLFTRTLDKNLGTMASDMSSSNDDCSSENKSDRKG
uniref:Uncharacterized protein n=1 Tax=Oryza punctata TaxID=4537 RepID=A0A0E0K9Y4_ORYPU